MALLESVFNHLVLPPKLPGQLDIDIEGIEHNVLTRLICACDSLGKLAGQDFGESWASIRRSLVTCVNANPRHLDKQSILRGFSQLQSNDVLILYLVEQNAALLLRHHVHDGVSSVVFESLEASPSSKDVLATDNALQWDFPGRAAKIPLGEFLEESFQESLANFLEQASTESLARFAAQSVKAETSVIEARDTTDPALITQMLLPLLEAVGSSIDVPRLRKRVRDDVNIENAEFPWRRLPLWLILRVAIQRQLCLVLGNETGQACYKFLICTVLAQLLVDCIGKLAPELTITLKAKLCRRLAKLEMDKTQVRPASAVYKQLFGSIGPLFKEIIGSATIQVDTAWANFKRTITRPIPPLSSRADEQALRLSLPNSEKYLFNLLSLPHLQQSRYDSPQTLPSSDEAMEQIQTFTKCYFDLARLESELEADKVGTPESIEDCKTRCVEITKSITNVYTAVGSAYDSDPEQTSTFVLTLFDLWVQMDKCALKACPILGNYHPVFTPELLDVLQLPTLSSMQRLQDVQIYLKNRLRKCQNPKTIFSEPSKDCFAVRYLEQSVDLRNLQSRIEGDSSESRQQKKTEWTYACNEYDKLSREISDGTCVCSVDPDGSRNVKGCKKCWQGRCRKRMKIEIHEDFLPKDSASRAAVIFELEIPSFLAAYRNATWRILSDLGHPSKPSPSPPPAMLLKDYHQLQRYSKQTLTGVSLASAKKSFSQTHYKAFKLKVDLSKISFPLGLVFSYYDMKSEIWLKDLDRPLTFQHLCGIYIPRTLQLSIIPPSTHPAPNPEGPSSYEIIASQSECPSDMSIHEFMAYQRLLSGRIRRWPSMLVELGASNLNFSTEETMYVYSQLAVQAGSAQNESDLLRDIHLVFRDQSFCQRLAEQIEIRFGNITSNWRETNCMEMLITLSLRLFVLASHQGRRYAEKLLKTAREITLQWISRLRNEIRKAEEADVAKRAARYGFWAALLCRRTFTTFVRSGSTMSADDTCSFIQASVALQENLVVDLSLLSQNLKNMLVRDTKMAYQFQPVIRKSIESDSGSVTDAIDKIWFGGDSSFVRTYSPWLFLSAPNNQWVVSTITNKTHDFVLGQLVHYNFVEGYLLVDGKPLRTLPKNIRESEDIKELFGNQHLFTFPSTLAGMSHLITTPIPNHEIHIGLRGKNVVIRALTSNGLLEYIPRRVFMNNNSYDLPISLVENCVHWLNLRSKRLEIRRKPAIWKTRLSDWTLDITKRRAQRNKVFLVDPHSDLCKRVADIFRHFEDAQRLTVYQPMTGPLCVEMRRLELSFYVNRSSLLECRELHAEIDPNQDAGTLYGFESKIVLRDVANIERRSIITALGQLTYKRHGMHIALRARSINEYGRFRIDDVLGRLSCPPEPLLIFSKIQFHAFTSFVLPDPLTGRTGVEEALHTLRSGYSQPWTTINDSPMSILRFMGRLSPGRDYYPKDKRRLQTVTWDKDLTTNIQHDSYEALIQDITRKSDQLRAFASLNEDAMDFDIQCPTHLRRRGEIRRLLYERKNSDSDTVTIANDMVYKPRDRQTNLPEAANVYQVVKLIRERPFALHMTKNLKSILQDWEFIGGFRDVPDSISSCLVDLIEGSISEQWGNLVNYCRCTDNWNPYGLVFRLGLLSFGTNHDMDAIKLLTAFASLHELKVLQPPSCAFFVGFKNQTSPTVDSIINLIERESPLLNSNPRKSEKKQERVREKYQVLCEAEDRRLAEYLLEQWPTSEPSVKDFNSDVIDVQLAFERILPELRRMYHNIELSEYVAQAQKILDHSKGVKKTSVLRAYNVNSILFRMPNRDPVIPSLSRDLLTKYGPNSGKNLSIVRELPTSRNLSRRNHSSSEQNDMSRPANQYKSREVVELSKILGSFAASPNIIRQQYGKDLEKSLIALENFRNQIRPQEMLPGLSFIEESIEGALLDLKHQFINVRNAFSVDDDRFQWLQSGNLWPCTTPVTILEQLRSCNNHRFGKHMREALVSSGVQVTILQRLLRIKDALLKGGRQKLLEDWENTGHDNWSPLDFADWLLLEIDSDILIRREQIDVAHAIISPASGTNSVLQMNMGKGKTSCIVPMAVAILANKKQLSRLIVPKALLLQTAQTVQSRIGGLVGREIRHIPFSRKTPFTSDMLCLYSELHREILHCCGVILTTPEHILSYKLSGLQRLADSKLKEAQEMVKFQSWLSNTCRDILDESDFTLAVKTQLIYPSGPQTTVDGHPYRWEVAQMLLSLVEDHLPGLQCDFPQSIEIVKRSHGFPMVCFLHTNVEVALHQRVINDICGGRTSFLRLANPISYLVEMEIQRVFSEENVNIDLIKRISCLFSDNLFAFKKILLVRGLLLHKILLLCLKKRWNVQYGLHPNRHPIAVPFEAKGVPSAQAEFGHPDVAILFTCLAFYCSGLSHSQLCECLRHLLKSDDPAAVYDKWTYGSDTLPEALHHWNIVNVDDQGQVEELWRHLRLNRNVLDYYLNNFVFPVYAKQFGVKLQASGWDLPLFSTFQLEQKTSCIKTTGFSGTNDNRMMLPLTIKQDDLASLQHTNAEVLTYLLHERNRQYILTAWQGKRLTEEGLLRRIATINIRILIDAGAYILEMDNRSLVKLWLSIDTQAKAAIYFEADNRAWVQYRGGKEKVPLIATPFAENFDDCLVYLDEAHTRGVDLKLPQNARGALTLALGQTKDHTVQAAMRLRQLGTTQSIVSFAPPEVHQSILDVCGKRQKETLDSSHVVKWLLEQTCRTNEQLQNLYIAQGMDFCRRTNAQWKNAKFLTNPNHRKAYLSIIQNPDRQTIEQLYGGLINTHHSFLNHPLSTGLQSFKKELINQRQAANSNGNAIFSSTLEEVEQEREVEFQVEEIRQVQKRIHFKALIFPGLHAAISNFAQHGYLVGGQGFEQAFAALARTKIGQQYNIRPTTSRLFISAEFMRTISPRNLIPNDDFLRPVEWILWNCSNETALIVIPEEAELLIPIIRAIKDPKVTMIAYAAPVTKKMLHFNRLSYYAIPSLPVDYAIPEWLSIELGVFAGRLYMGFSECISAKKYLGLADDINKGLQSNINNIRSLTDNPVNFLLDWLALRRKGQDIMHTPMGYLCQGRPLHESHPFFVTRSAYVEGIIAPAVRGQKTDGEDEDEDEESEIEDLRDSINHMNLNES